MLFFGDKVKEIRPQKSLQQHYNKMAAVSALVTSPAMTQSLLGRVERFEYQLKSKSGLTLPPEDMEFGLRKSHRQTEEKAALALHILRFYHSKSIC